MRVALTYNLKPQASTAPRPDYFAEWDDSATIEAVSTALAGGGREVVGIEADRDLAEKLKRVRPDIVFNIAEGIDSPSRESQVPVICEMLEIPYTGSDAFTL